MNYSVLPFFFILLSLGTLIALVVRKLPQLTLLDVDNIPEVKEGKKKEQILKKRVAEKMNQAQKQRAVMFLPLVQAWKNKQLAFRKYVGGLERRVLHERERRRAEATPAERVERVDQVRSLLHDGTHSAETGDTVNAEKKFIAAIRIDSKNAEAYRGLGDVYYGQEQYAEAKETYQFLLQLDPQDDRVLARLAEVAEAENHPEEAIRYYEQAVLINDNIPSRFVRLAELLNSMSQYETAFEAIRQAVELEPQNPKYLDMLVEISIMAGTKDVAEEAYHALRMVNPENQKLPVLKAKIAQMS